MACCNASTQSATRRRRHFSRTSLNTRSTALSQEPLVGVGWSGGAVEPDVVGAAGGVCDRVLPGAAADELGDRAGRVDRQQCRGVFGGGDRRGDELGGWTAATT